MDEYIFDWRDLDLDTFDCLVCDPAGFPWIWIDHTAGLVKKPNDSLWVYESTQRKGGGGVGLVTMDRWLARRSGEVRVRQLSIEDGMRQIANIRSEQHIKICLNKPYPPLKKRIGRLMMYKTVLDPTWPKWLAEWCENPDIPTELCKWFYCTHVYCDWLKYCCLTEDFNSAEQEPDNVRHKSVKVSGAGTFEKYLLPGVVMGQEIRIK